MASRLLLLLFFFAAMQAGWAQPDQFRFKRLDINDGLSNNYVTCFLKDSKGFLWVGTVSGLNRYDGYSFKTFHYDVLDTASLINSSISKLAEGPDGKIWITTPQGVNVYDPSAEKIIRNSSEVLARLNIPTGNITDIQKDNQQNYWFIHEREGLFLHSPNRDNHTRSFKPVANDSTSLHSQRIASVASAKDGELWIVHRDGILEKMNVSTGAVTYRNDFLFRINKGHALQYSIMTDRDGDLWIHILQDNRGVYFFQAAQKAFTHYQKDSGVPQLNTNIVRGIAQDNNGLIWIGTDHGGINIINKKDQSIRYILYDADDETSLSQNTVNTVYHDDQGIVWAGTYKDGISYYHEDLFRFPLYKKNRVAQAGLPYNDINRFAEDEKGNLWMASNGGGLIYYDRKNQTYKQYLHQPGNKNSIGNNVIVSLYFDRENKLWIGTYYGGLSCYDGKKFITYRHSATNPNSLSHDSVWEIYEDRQGNLWIGTLDGGLEKFDRKTQTFVHFPGVGGRFSIHSSYVSEVLEDDQGQMWIGTAYGLEVLKPQTGEVAHYLNNPTNAKTISNNVIHAIFQDSRGLIWIGTASGLNLFDPQTQAFRVFRKEDGLPHQTIVSIIEDNSGRLWMSTLNGLSAAEISFTESSINGVAIRFTNYDESDGLQGKEFNENAAFKTSKGELVFGGPKGFTLFHPDHVKVNANIPRVVISDFELFNKRVAVGKEMNGEIILKESIVEAPAITLKHSDNFFAFHFAALSYMHPEKNQYQYILEGFNKEWITTDEKSRKAIYTNLDPGTYTFRVKASNNDGQWNETGASLSITILPPFWKSNLAVILYILLILAALFTARHMLLLRERGRFQLQQEREAAQRMHDLDTMKIKFFTNLSHEFRTPLTLILTPLEKLIKNAQDTPQRNQYHLIQRNARRLLSLVNQLLDFRKLETQGIKFNPSEGDVIQFVRDVTYSFSDLSEKKDIRLSFQSSVQKFETLFDQDKLEKILFNLLSNAFKFTPEHGTVSVEMALVSRDDSDAEKKWMRIQVSDTGIGIPVDKQEKIFERFFQHDLPASLVNQGSGIGLAITREFIKLHGGTVTVKSLPEKGSSFSVLLPLPELSAIARTEFITAHTRETLVQHELVHESDGSRKKPVLLLIEDNEDFRFYLKDNLRAEYAVYEARNGNEGWTQAITHVPDLIVSDIMMPEMNGIDLCRKLKEDSRTSHIPVVLLTARTSEEQKLEGYRTGAHDYIVKPFSFEILQLHIRNLVRQQEIARKVFQNKMAVKGSSIEVTSLDEKLIQKAIAFVEKNIEDPDFSVETLSHEMGMSRIHLYRKIHSLTGKSPTEFIRSIRLQYAAQLLEKSQLNVSEVAYRVGFNNPKYFSKYFKEEFNVLPSVYASQRTSGRTHIDTSVNPEINPVT